MNIEVGYARDGVKLSISVQLTPQAEVLASVSHLAPEERESVFCEAWGRLHPQVAAQLNASLQQLAGEILGKFALSCEEGSLASERVALKKLAASV
jgi:hypothetical protein